jgi:hypothetical protein
MPLIDVPETGKPKGWADVRPRRRRPLKNTLSSEQLKRITHPTACEDVTLSYKEELQQAQKEAGAWELRALVSEGKLAVAQDEVKRLRRANDAQVKVADCGDVANELVTAMRKIADLETLIGNLRDARPSPERVAIRKSGRIKTDPRYENTGWIGDA